MSLIRKHVAVLQAWACLALVLNSFFASSTFRIDIAHCTAMLKHLS